MEPKLVSVTVRRSGDTLRMRWDAGQCHQAILDSFRRAFHTSQRRFSGGYWSVPVYLAFELRTWVDHVGFERIDWEDEPARSAPPTPLPRSPRTDALRLLRLADDAPDGLIDIAYRWWSQQLHPDRGGAHADMVRLNAARAVLCAGRQRAS